MTIENLLSQVGMATKQLTDRYSGEYGAPVHDQQIYYSYEPSPAPQGHGVSKHSHSGGGLKSNASMSALTLLAFLFFLHILQQCIKEHMNEMNTPVVVMSASREGDINISKTAKIDKSGDVQINTEEKSPKTEYDKKNPFKKSVDPDNKMLRISASDNKPLVDTKQFGYVYDKDDDSSFPGFVSAMKK